ncbi:cytochrome P450 monooxygenase [Xylaria bambusicola]|uniref:cytochrome P450 monooxygenase n=1 Tax=Xylaria bambusicola TaxID=326684 RepID=UPI00200878B6|nr:cytochrome P450 monooxygenase [Xylaria bambusicola]KAI0512527.1 cytochrome P450 monooxygenase [Xylaria bambusicola]
MAIQLAGVVANHNTLLYVVPILFVIGVNYPGPLISRASTLWYSRALGRGTIAQDLLALHEKYGDTVRITPDEISFIDPQNWKQIYGYRTSPAGKVEMIKDPRYHDTVKPTVTILTGNDAEHTYFRKILSPPFSEISLKKNEWILHRFVDKFIARVKDAGDNGKKPVDIVDWFNYLTFDIIGYLAYGEDFNCLGESKLHEWIDCSLAIAGLMTLGQSARQLPYPFDKLYKWMFIPDSIYRRTKTHRDLVDQKVHTRLGHNPEHMDFLQKLVELRKDEKMEFGTLSEHASLLTIGGSETTATLLSGAIYFLALNPEVYAKLKREIRTTFAKEEDMTLLRLSQCAYLLGVVEETLRMYPPSPANHTRMVPEGGAVLEGKHIPGGLCVSMPMFASFNASSNWVEPRVFAPERWTGENPDKYARDRKEALKPFSYGPRNCLGQQLANHEVRLILGKVAWHFDLELMEASRGWEKQISYTFWEKHRLWVKMKSVT